MIAARNQTYTIDDSTDQGDENGLDFSTQPVKKPTAPALPASPAPLPLDNTPSAPAGGAGGAPSIPAAPPPAPIATPDPMAFQPLPMAPPSKPVSPPSGANPEPPGWEGPGPVGAELPPAPAPTPTTGQGPTLAAPTAPAADPELEAWYAAMSPDMRAVLSNPEWIAKTTGSHNGASSAVGSLADLSPELRALVEKVPALANAIQGTPLPPKIYEPAKGPEEYMINGEVIRADGSYAPSSEQQQRTIGGVTTPYRNFDNTLGTPNAPKPPAESLAQLPANGLPAPSDRGIQPNPNGPVIEQSRPITPGPATDVPKQPAPPVNGLPPGPTQSAPAPAQPSQPTPQGTNGLPPTSGVQDAVKLTPTTPDSALTNYTISPGSAVDRYGIAKTKYSDWEKETDPQFQAQMRDSNRWSAAAGRIGSGLAVNSIGDIQTQRENDTRTHRDNFLADALTGSIDDAWRSIGLAERQQAFEMLQQTTGFAQGMDLQKLSDAEQQQAFTQAMQQMLAGYSGDQSAMYAWMASVFGTDKANELMNSYYKYSSQSSTPSGSSTNGVPDDTSGQTPGQPGVN